MEHDVQDREEEVLEREQLNAGWGGGADDYTWETDPDVWVEDPDEWGEE